MNHHASNLTPARALRTAARLAPLLALAMTLSACETPLNTLRVQRFAGTKAEASAAQPRALALALKTTPDGLALTHDSIEQANAMLLSQGRIQGQSLTITPFNAQGERVATRLAAALERSGAAAPAVLAKPTDADQLASAAANGWDLELQSDALVIQAETCTIAQPQNWMMKPYTGVGALGCATRANIARMVSDPRDLSRPRTLDAADGRAAAAAVDRYQTGKLRDPIDINFNNN